MFRCVRSIVEAAAAASVAMYKVLDVCGSLCGHPCDGF